MLNILKQDQFTWAKIAYNIKIVLFFLNYWLFKHCPYNFLLHFMLKLKNTSKYGY